jgi:hypothetical protein
MTRGQVTQSSTAYNGFLLSLGAAAAQVSLEGRAGLGGRPGACVVEGRCRLGGLREQGSPRPVVLLAATRLRRSELLALRWEDVDLDGRVLTVTGSVAPLKGQGLVRQDRTKGRRRAVSSAPPVRSGRAAPTQGWAAGAEHGQSDLPVVRRAHCGTRTTSESSGARYASPLVCRTCRRTRSERQWPH